MSNYECIKETCGTTCTNRSTFYRIKLQARGGLIVIPTKSEKVPLKSSHKDNYDDFVWIIIRQNVYNICRKNDPWNYGFGIVH